MQIPLAVVGYASPSATAKPTVPIVRRLAAIITPIEKEIPVALRAARRRLQRRFKPRVLIGRVIGHNVHKHFEAERVCPCQ